MDLQNLILGIELGSTRIKGVLIDENHNVIASGGKEGMCAMDQAILALLRAGKISRETALEYADHPEQMTRQLG